MEKVTDESIKYAIDGDVDGWILFRVKAKSVLKNFLLAGGSRHRPLKS